MIQITKRRFLEIFAVGTKWRITQCWWNDGTRPRERTVLEHKASKVITQLPDGQTSTLRLTGMQPLNEYYYDEATGALEIRNKNEGPDAKNRPYFVLRYEKDE